jgi:hypothetical protein
MKQVKIELHVFSGRPNPTLILRGKRLQEFTERLTDFDEGALRTPAGLLLPLGYGGFSIHHPKSAKRSSLHIHSSRLDPSKSLDLERWLLKSMDAKVPGKTREYVEGEIPRGTKRASMIQGRTVGSPRVIVPDHPIYEPEDWNIPSVQPYNNCYAYGCNDPTNTFPQPGLGTGHEYQNINAAEVTAGALSDGLKRLSSWSDTPAQGWKVVMVIWPDTDYHWYRQDELVAPETVRLCSHKPGSTEVRQVDNSNKVIQDPTASTCDHGPYTIVAGVFNVPGREFITIK